MHAQGKFTGWHMTAILVAFFGIVIAVNFTMARLAVTSFGGTVVDNSYVASQHYNDWLAAADRQERLGWTVKASLSADRHVAVQVELAGQSLSSATVIGDARHRWAGHRTWFWPLSQQTMAAWCRLTPCRRGGGMCSWRSGAVPISSNSSSPCHERTHLCRCGGAAAGVRICRARAALRGVHCETGKRVGAATWHRCCAR